MQNIESIKDVIELDGFLEERYLIINKHKFFYLDIGYIPCESDVTGNEHEGIYLVLVDDNIYFIDPFYDGYVSERFYNSIATDYKFSLNERKIYWEQSKNKIVEVQLTDHQLSELQTYKVLYRENVIRSETFQNVFNKLLASGYDKVTDVGFIGNSEDGNSVVPYQCFMFLIDEQAIFINIFTDYYHQIQIDSYRYSTDIFINMINQDNRTLKIKEYGQHKNKEFEITVNQVELIKEHIDFLYSRVQMKREKEELMKDVELKQILSEMKKAEKNNSSIIHDAQNLSNDEILNVLLINFLEKYTNSYYLYIQNHSFRTFSLNISERFIMPKEFGDGLTLLVKLFENKGYFENSIEEEQKIEIIVLALQYVSIKYYSRQFASKFIEIFKDIDFLPLDKCLDRFTKNFQIHGGELNAFIHFLISKNKLVYDVNLIDQIKMIKEMIDEIEENYKLSLFENSLSSDMASEIINFTNIDDMSGREFEEFISDLFTKMGYRTEITKASKDQGVDVIARSITGTVGIQAKRFQVEHSVSNKAVQEIYAGIKYYQLDKGIVATSSYFTGSAKELAEKNNIILWDRDDLEKLFRLNY